MLQLLVHRIRNVTSELASEKQKIHSCDIYKAKYFKGEEEDHSVFMCCDVSHVFSLGNVSVLILSVKHSVCDLTALKTDIKDKLSCILII